MAKTNIDYADEVSNPLFAREKGTDQKIGTFCEKPDKDGTCKNCWAEVFNLRFGNKLAFDKTNRDKIEWKFRPNELNRLAKLNAKKPMSEKFAGLPLVVFCCDTFDIFQPSITDEMRDVVFNFYDELTNLILLIQTTYPAKMNHYFKARYNGGLPKHYWIGMSAGTQKFLDQNAAYLLEINASVRYVIAEPLTGEVDLSVFLPNEQMRGFCGWIPLEGIEEYVNLHDDNAVCITCRNPLPSKMIDWVIVGGESGHGARSCDIAWIRSIVQQCKDSETAVFVKQLGAFPVTDNINFVDFDIEPKMTPYGTTAAGAQLNLKSKKGGDIAEFPADLQVREMPKMEK